MQRKVLVVEDDLWQADLIKKLLVKYNYDVQSVESAKEALEWLERCEVALLLVDMELGRGMDGLEMFMRTKIMRPTQKGIMVSGFWGGAFPAEVKKYGFPPFLKSCLRSWVELHYMVV